MKAKVSKSRIMVWLVKLLAILLVVSLVPITMAVKASADDGQKEEVAGSSEQIVVDDGVPVSDTKSNYLIVKKRVAKKDNIAVISKDGSVEKDRSFEFEVVVIPPSGNSEQAPDVTANLNKAYKFSLKDGGEEKIRANPDCRYQIRELTSEGYKVTGTVVFQNPNPNELSKKGTFQGAETTVGIKAGMDTIVTFVNTPVPAPVTESNYLIVKKRVAKKDNIAVISKDGSVEKDRSFEFEVIVIPPSGNSEQAPDVTANLNKAYKFSLKDGGEEKIRANPDCRYQIRELTSEGYEVTGTVVFQNPNPNELSKKGTFQGAETTVGIKAGMDTIVTFVNTPVPTPEPGADFTVVKKVDGIEGSLQKFRFVLWVQGMEGEKFEGLEFDDKARAKFQLAAGEELVLRNLPAKREFELTELPADYYTPHFSVEQGIAEEMKDGVHGFTLDIPTVILVINKFAGFDPIDDEILPLTIDVKAKKIWEGGAGPRPDVEFELYREVPDGYGVKLEKVPDVSTLKIVDGETEVVWPKLRRCNSEGVEYNYYVIELTELDDYKMERVDYLTIKNVYLGGSETDPPTDDGGDPPPAGDEGPGTGEEGPGELVLGESIELGSGDESGPGEKVLGEEDVKAPATGEQLSVYLYLALLMTAMSLLLFWKGRRAVEKE